MPSQRTDRRFGISASVAVKAPVVAASTGVLVLSGSTQIIDGSVRSTGQRILVKEQSGVGSSIGSTENGIYEIRGTAWVRTADADGFPDFVPGTAVFISTGSTDNDQGGRFFTVGSTTSTDGHIRPGTDTLDFSQLDALLNPYSINDGEVGTVQLADEAVTLAKMADIDTQRFVGRNTASSGVPESLTVATAKTMLGITGGGGIGNSITDIVIDHGADPTGIIDASTRIQDAIETRRAVYVPPGTYKTSTQLDFLHVNSTNTSQGQWFYGAGEDVSIIAPTTDFPSTSKVFNLASGEPGSKIKHLSIEFATTQTSVANRAALPAQPDAIYVNATPRFEIENVKITKGMNGIVCSSNCGGAVVNNVKLACFENNIQFDFCLDTMRFSQVHVWPFGGINGSSDYENIWYDDTTKAMDIGRVDDCKVDGLLTHGPKVHIHDSTYGIANSGFLGEFSNCDFDAYGGLYIDIGLVNVSNSLFTIKASTEVVSPRHAIQIAGTSTSLAPQVNITGCYIHTAGDAATAGVATNNTLILHARGTLNVTGSHFDMAASTMRSIVSFTGGASTATSANIVGNTFEFRTTGGLSNAIVLDSEEPSVVVGNKFRHIITPIIESSGLGNIGKNIIHGNDYGSTVAVSFYDFMQLRNISSTRLIANFQTDNDGAESGPIISISRKSGSAANGDLGGDLRFQMDTANGTGEITGRILNTLLSNVDGQETGQLVIQTPTTGNLLSQISISDGIQIGAPTGGYKGHGTINSTGYYVNGALLGGGSGSTSILDLDSTSLTTDMIHLEMAEDGAARGPVVTLYRKSGTAANGDILGDITFAGNTANGSSEIFGRIMCDIISNANGSESGEIQMQTPIAGVFSGRLNIANGVKIGNPTGGYKGDGTINAAGMIYVNNVPLSTSTGNMFGANNLSDVSNAASARSNIGAGTPINLAVPGAIGGTTPSTGTFTQIFAAHGVSNTHAIRAHATHATYTANCIISNVTRPANTGYNFFTCYSGNLGDVEFILRGDGHAFADNNWNAGGADYAEYFEWEDANPSDSDRRGIAVIMDGDKIREAEAGEIPFGIISGNPSVVGNAAALKWERKYLRDDFGTRRLTKGGTRRLNPQFDPDAEYKPRSDRPEWACVGLVGRLRLLKGQATDPRWMFMRRISDKVEEWLVR